MSAIAFGRRGGRRCSTGRRGRLWRRWSSRRGEGVAAAAVVAGRARVLAAAGVGVARVVPAEGSTSAQRSSVADGGRASSVLVDDAVDAQNGGARVGQSLLHPLHSTGTRFWLQRLLATVPAAVAVEQVAEDL